MTHLLGQAANSIYFFCTDFMISSANLLGWTYVDTNSLLLLIIFPLAPVCLGAMAIWQGRLLRQRLTNSPGDPGIESARGRSGPHSGKASGS